MNDVYMSFRPEQWASFRENTPLTLKETDLQRVNSLNDRLSLQEVENIYLPLSRLLNLYVSSSQALNKVTDTFLGKPGSKVPFVIGVAGSVAVGKSTISRVLRELLSHWEEHPNVALITTDGFLYPNRVLEHRRIMNRKGFPESYDTAKLLNFVMRIKAGHPKVSAPVYSHERYDIVPGQENTIENADIVIIEGLNVLQSGASSVFVSDFFDFSIYVDAAAEHIEKWYVQRFLTLRDTVFRRKSSYFRGFANLDDGAARDEARAIWRDINLKNLHQNILPTRERAKLILRKGPDHLVEKVMLRKL